MNDPQSPATVKETRYTLTLPSKIYEELQKQAQARGSSVKDLVRQSLKLGLLAMELESNEKAGVFIKETVEPGVIRETRLILA